jgi:hypothetical protein
MSAQYLRIYKPPFRSFVKKASKPLALAIEDEVDDICTSAHSGLEKKGDLAGIRVHKFRFQRQEYLIAYRSPTIEEARAGEGLQLLNIDFYQVGPHENFYTQLKWYLKH